jgi:hypothetical protein
MPEREEWRKPAHKKGDCVASVPAEILMRYAAEGPELELRGELPPVPEPRPEDFENPAVFSVFRSASATP